MQGGAVVVGVGESEYYKRGGSPETEFQLAIKAITRAADDAGLDVSKIDGLISYMDDRNNPLRMAAALGLDVDLQATDKAKALLGKQRHTPKHIPAMKWQEVPAFYQSLGRSVTELALKLLILTAVRSYPLRNIHEDQIDGDVWTIPAAHMKGRVGSTSDFRVPLSTEAQAVIAEAHKFARDGFL